MPRTPFTFFCLLSRPLRRQNTPRLRPIFGVSKRAEALQRAKGTGWRARALARSLLFRRRRHLAAATSTQQACHQRCGGRGVEETARRAHAQSDAEQQITKNRKEGGRTARAGVRANVTGVSVVACRETCGSRRLHERLAQRVGCIVYTPLSHELRTTVD